MQHPSYEPSGAADFLPPWARVADLACVVLMAASTTIALSGGFRLRVGAWHIAMTSPTRLAMWAVAVGVVRHAVVRQHSIVAHLAVTAQRLVCSEAVRHGVRVAAATCPLFWFVGALAVSTIGYAPNASPFHEFSRELFNLPLRWDAGWYLQIAANGYEFVRNAPADLQQNVVFFPAYPMIVRGVGLIGGRSMAAFVAGGVLVSLVFFAIGLAYLYALCRTVLDDDRSSTALWLAATYPFALFFGAIYTESLYLAATTGALYHLRCRQWGRAAAWAFLVGLSRPQGILFALPLATAAIVDARATRTWSRRSVAVVLAPPIAAACYSAFIWWLTGNPMTWATGHTAWGRHYTGLSQLVTDRYNFIASAGFPAYVVKRPFDLLNALGVLFALAAVVPIAARFSIAWALVVLIDVLPGLFSGGLLSMGRFSSVAFPAFVWLADVVPIRQRPAWLAGFASLQALNAALFYTWRPLF